MKIPIRTSNAVKALNPGLYSEIQNVTHIKPDIRAEEVPKIFEVFASIRPSRDEDKLNKTEKAYLEYMRALNPQWIGIQCITLKLGDDCRYTPDFIAIDNLGVIHAREVKGFWRDDARVKIKVASRLYPWMRFTAAQLIKGNWKHEEIHP